MKVGLAILLFAGVSSFVAGQENPSAIRVAPPSIGIEVGQRAPAFALPDQFGHEQSNDTLKGSKGTVLLFFRSADW
jgi:hypothetical protein